MADARHENENLREQVKLLKQSMSALFENQRKAQEEVEYLRKVQSKGMRVRSVCDFFLLSSCTVYLSARVTCRGTQVFSSSAIVCV